MYIVFLKFGENKAQAKDFMSGHNAWINDGFSAGHFAMTGSVLPNSGGAILVRDMDRALLDALLLEDPFVAENVVIPEIVEVRPGKWDDQLAFLVEADTSI